MKKIYEQPEATAFSLCPGAPLALSVVTGENNASTDFDVLSNRKNTPRQPWGSTLWADEEESGN